MAIEVGQLEVVQIGDIESADAQTGQGEQVTATDTAEASDGDTPGSQQGLFGFRNPADVAGKGSIVVERSLYDRSALIRD